MRVAGGYRLDRRARLLLWAGGAAAAALPVLVGNAIPGFDWSLVDHLLFAGLILVLVAAIDWGLRRSDGWTAILGWATAMLAAFLLVWTSLAVGVIGQPGDPANLLVWVVPMVAMGGAVAVRLDALRMVRVMQATAAAQAVVGLVAAAHQPRTLGATAFFVAAWLLSAGLFRRAS